MVEEGEGEREGGNNRLREQRGRYRLTDKSKLPEVDLISETEIKLSRIVWKQPTLNLITNTSAVTLLLVL